MTIDVKKVVEGIIIAVGVSFVGLNIIAKKNKSLSIYDNEKEQKNPLEGKKVIFIEDENDQENADGVRGHLKEIGISNYYPSFYIF